jgi:hypothetical protein
MPLWRSSNQPSTRSNLCICWLAERSPLPSTSRSRTRNGELTSDFSSSVSVGRSRAKAPGEAETALNTRAASGPLRTLSPICATNGNAQATAGNPKSFEPRNPSSVSAGSSRAAQTSEACGRNTGSDSAQPIRG